jgi:hypothetical protein
MPAGKPYTPQAYQTQLKKLEVKVGRASTTMARKKAQDAVKALKKTRSKYYTKNPADRAVRRAGAAVKKTAKKVVRKAKSANARAQASGAVNKRRAIEKLEARLKRTNDPFKKREIRKELTAARKAKGNVFAKAGKRAGTVNRRRTGTVTRQDETVARMQSIRSNALKKARGIAGAGSPPVSMRPKARRVASKSRKITGRRR